MINISLKHTLPAYQSSHYTGKVNCVRGGLGPLNHEKVAHPSTCLLTHQNRPNKHVFCTVFYEFKLFPQKEPPTQQGTLYLTVTGIYWNNWNWQKSVERCELIWVVTVMTFGLKQCETDIFWERGRKIVWRKWTRLCSSWQHAGPTPVHTHFNNNCENVWLLYISGTFKYILDVINGKFMNY